MANRCELPVNVVMLNERSRAGALGQTRHWGR
jgi:hypothetical protein